MRKDWQLPGRLIEYENLQLDSKENEPISRFPIMGVVGPLGAGKSTLSELMEHLLNVPNYPVKRFTENYPDNEFLPFMFQGKAFESEMVFLRSKMEQLSQTQEMSREHCLVVDPCAEGDALFAHAVTKMGWMSKYKFGKYMEEFGTLRETHNVLPPDIFVVVNADPGVLRTRIEQRIAIDPSRDFEKEILTSYPEYLDVMHDAVNSFADSVRGIKPIIYIDSGRRDFVNYPAGKSEVIEEVVNWMGYYAGGRERFGNFASDNAELIMPNF